MTTAKPILTVVGATGAQGGSVVKAALKAGIYQVRAITRNVLSDAAKGLASKGVEVVTADLNDEASLRVAFEGSTAIYAVTDFFEPFSKGGPEHAIEVEVKQGENLANAALKTPTLKHYIWSTLPNAMKISNGQYLVPHFEAKNRIDAYIKKQPELIAKTTFLWVTWYASNYLFPMFTPNFVKTSGKYLHLQPVPQTVPIISIGDAYTNVGIFTNSILSQPSLTQGGKYIHAYVEKTTIGDLLERWSKVSGKPSVYVQTTSLESFDAVFPMWGHEMGIMMLFWEKYGEGSWSGEEVILNKDDLKIDEKEFVGVDKAYETLDLGH